MEQASRAAACAGQAGGKGPHSVPCTTTWRGQIRPEQPLRQTLVCTVSPVLHDHPSCAVSHSCSSPAKLTAGQLCDWLRS